MKRTALLAALVLLAGCAGQPGQPSASTSPTPASVPTPIPAPVKETGSTQQSPLSDDPTIHPHPETDGIRHGQSSKCSEQQETIEQNLRIAGEADLPVPTLDVWARVDFAIGPKQFRERHTIDPTPDVVQKQVEQGEWRFVGRPGIVALLVPSSEKQPEALADSQQYAFDPGALTAGSPVSELASRFRSVLEAGKVVASTVKAISLDPGAEQYTVWWGKVDPNTLLSHRSNGCSIQTVRTYQDGRFGWVDIPMIELRNAAFLGFAQDRVVTFDVKSGTFGTRWYTVPGIRPLE